MPFFPFCLFFRRYTSKQRKLTLDFEGYLCYHIDTKGKGILKCLDS